MGASYLETSDGVTVGRVENSWPVWMGSGGGTVMLDEIILDKIRPQIVLSDNSRVIESGEH